MKLLIDTSELGRTVRGLRRRPLVPLVLTAVVAVGVAFLVTAFSVFDALLWRGTPYGPHDRFVLLGEVTDIDAIPPTPRIRADTYGGYQDAFDRGRLDVLEGLVPFDERATSLTVDGVARPVVATRLLPNAFALLQGTPLLGRTPADPDGERRLAREIAIGEHLWTRQFGRRRDVLGQRVTADGEAAVIVGVMPAQFRFYRTSEVWIAWSRSEVLQDPTRAILLVGRIAEGRAKPEVSAYVEPIRRAVRAGRMPRDTVSSGYGAPGLYGREYVPSQIATGILVSMALVLGAACLNLATLYLARLRRRAGDHATRQALGAGPSGVLRHLLLEIALLVAAGGAAAVMITLLATAEIRTRMDGVLLDWVDVRPGVRGFMMTLAALTLVLAVVAVPSARLVRRLDLARLLTHKGVLGGAPGHGRGASALIALQVAVVVILAAAALPIAVSALKLADVQTGIAADRIVRVDVTMAGVAYATDTARQAYAARVRHTLAANPQVAGVARVGSLQSWRAGPRTWSDTIYTDASAEPVPPSRTRRLWEDVVSAEYFAVTGLPRMAGRTFEPSADAAGERVAVIAAETARQLWPGETSVGRRFRRGANGPWVRVVGVVGDETMIWEDWSGTTAEPAVKIYYLDEQATPGGMSFYVRARQPSAAFAQTVRAAVEAVDLTQPVAEARLLADAFAIPRVQRQWIAVVLASGAVAAVLLAITGVVGLVSYYTAARLPELALRMALGAPLRAEAWLVAEGTLRSIMIGLACGALTLTIIQDGVRRFTFETSTSTPTVLLLIAVVVLTVAAVAIAVPLRRLARLSPHEVLRLE